MRFKEQQVCVCVCLFIDELYNMKNSDFCGRLSHCSSIEIRTGFTESKRAYIKIVIS